MKNKNLSARFIGKFSSIQSVIFATVAVLVLSAVVIVTGVSMKFTNTSIFENSSEYTHTIIQQMNQNIDSYIDYMENIAYLISSNEDVQDYLFDEKIDNEGRYRILNQLQTILDSRSDIRNVGIISKNGRMLINDGSKSVNQDLDLNTQEWYATALEKPNGPILTSSHVQHIISGERPWVITLSRGIRDRSGSGEKEGVFFIDLNYSAISELCDQSTVGTKGYAFILDAKGNIVYHPQQQQLYNELQTENISLIMDTDEDTVLTGTGNDGKLYSISRSEKTGWTVVDCTNVKELLSKSRQAQSVYVLTAIILVIVALLFSRFMARSITLPIQKLRDSMKKVQEGDFSVSDVVVDSKNEIANEVEYARGYLTIQKMRYKDKLEFQIEVDSSILYIPLIKLVLQPIIENAIYHGLKYKESKGLLIVKGFMKDGNAVLQVIDDGVGMDEETLAHIYDKHKVNYHSNGVGVYNVQKRLKLYYGEDYGITYTSELGKGTTATITIPGRQEGQI